jgi:hypothetical protein
VLDITIKKCFGLAMDGALLLVKEECSYWLIDVLGRFCDWRIFGSLGGGQCLQVTHTGPVYFSNRGQRCVLAVENLVPPPV